MKGDTYLIFALLALYRLEKTSWAKEMVIRWCNSLEKYLLDEDGGFFNYWSSQTGERATIELCYNHSVIETLLDIYYDLKYVKALEMAEKCAYYWLRLQNNLGLFPDTAQKDLANLDPQLDFSINLLKLSELTGKEIYEKIAMSNFLALLTYHKLPYGFAQSVRFNSGKPVNSVVETKYLGLLIKGFLIWRYKFELNRSLFEDRMLRRLTSDR